MKRFAKVLGWMSIVGALLLFSAHSDAEPLGAMRVKLVQGDVQVKIADTGEWVPASVNMPLLEGDELWVPEGGRAALQTIDGNHVRLDQGTALQVLRMDLQSYQLHLTEGRAYVLNRAPKRSVLQIDTPDASIRAFGNSTFRIDIPGEETDLSVLRGSVQSENGEGTTTVRAGDMLALGADGYAEMSPVPPADEWQRWNAARDRIVLSRGRSYGYLPEELRPYSSDFDDNGRWVNVPEYGYCWTPTVVVVDDWAPYRHGRWVWRGGEYVWIGYEPWGWAPYHYGRWAFTAGIGWIWVPPARGDVYWAPGYVGWVRTPDYVGWVPLAPRETYYGYGNHGRYSRNITNVNITQIQVTNVYRNVNVGNSVTVVSQTTFVTGRPAPVDRRVVGNVREDFARHRNIVVGRPPIRPVETSYMPVVRTIPEAKRPPADVRRIDAKELRQSRPLVREQDRSAFRPQGKPAPLQVRKIEKPRPASERAKERQQAVPRDRRGPAASQGPPPGAVERRVAPREEEPKGREKPEPKGSGRPERPQPPPPRVRPEPQRQGPPPGAVERRVAPREEEPKGKEKPEPKGSGRPERPPPPPPRVRPEPQRQGPPPGAVERRVAPREEEPKGKAKPEPKEKAKPEPKEKAKPERPQGPPGRDAERPDGRDREEERGNRR